MIVRNMQYRTLPLALVLLVVTGPASLIHAQGYGPPLTMQGIDDPTLHSVAMRGLGGISFARTADPALMFRNPSSLRGLEGISISVGGLQRSVENSQDQHWLPLRNFPTFSLMMEGLLDKIRDPDFTESPDDGFGPEDSIPRPFDAIGPNWSRSRQQTQPLQVTAAAPFEIAGFSFQAGVGFGEYADLNHSFQNNNVLDPSIGTQRPAGVPLPGIGQETPVMWSRSARTREGAIYGYGAAVSAEIFDGLTVGASALLLSGTSDDTEESIQRARVLFGNNNNVYYYRLDSVYSISTSTGTSDYNGSQLSLSGMYQSGVLTIGFQVHPPTTIERSVSSTISIDTTGTPVQSVRSTTDKITLPWRGSVGFSLQVRGDLVAGFEYEARPYSSAEFSDEAGAVSRPWLSSSVFKAGAEYRAFSWLALRGGFRKLSRTFEEEGNALVGEPVQFSVYSAGIGLSLTGFRLDMAYEFSEQKYQDMWQTNVNLNRTTFSNIITSISYTIH